MQAARFLCPFMLCYYLTWVGVTTAKPVYTSDSLYSLALVEAVKELFLALCLHLYRHVYADGPFTGPQIGVGWGVISFVSTTRHDAASMATGN